MSKVYEGGIITYLHKVDGPLVHAVIETPAVGVAGRDMKERMLRVRPAARCAGSAASCTASTRRTRRPCAWGVRRALRVLAAASAAEVGTHRSDGQRFACSGGATEAELEAFLDGVDAPRGPQSKAEDWSLCCSAHQIGNCRMGATPRDGAVDAHGESW
jgi:long-chain-alcohol oxidase